uniref:TGL n=1 Tax=Eriocheir sinensis TaxID=95602 RepID=A0AAU7YU80_ERISI
MASRAVMTVMAVVVAVSEAAAIPAWRYAKPLSLPKTKTGEVQEWCDDVLGCLYLDETWELGTLRPVNQLPDSREKIGTTFMLHTRANPAIYEDIVISADDPSTIDATTFDPSKPTKIVTHGFIDTGYLKWLRQLSEALLEYGDYNVIRVDWGGGSLPMYSSACANIRVVGLEMARLVNFLADNYGLDRGNVHLAGHSLGSHASGYAGEKIEGLGRITGMDPAGPYFTGTPNFVRLDPTDAVFVDAIHTDADTILLLGYGTEQPMGNLDFYPNSGHDQPGCDPVNIGIDMIDDIGDGIRELAACSHARSYEFFKDSLYKPCPYLAHECFDYDSFELGRCASCSDDNTKCAYMGIRAEEYVAKERENVKLYLDTGKDAPYCLYHYQVIVDTASPKEAEDWVQGHLDVTLYGDNGEIIENLRLTGEHERFEHGQPKYFMFKSTTDLSRVIRVVAEWHYDDTLTNIGSYCWMLLCNRALYVRSIQIAPMDYYPQTAFLDHSRVLCKVNSDYLEIKSGDTANLDYDESCVFSVSNREATLTP